MILTAPALRTGTRHRYLCAATAHAGRLLLDEQRVETPADALAWLRQRVTYSVDQLDRRLAVPFLAWLDDNPEHRRVRVMLRQGQPYTLVVLDVVLSVRVRGTSVIERMGQCA